MRALLILSPLLLAWVAIPVTALAGRLRRGRTSAVALFMASLVFGAAVWIWLAGGGAVRIPWASSWNLHLAFEADGLAALFTVLASGIGALVLLYSSGYIPHHLSQEKQPDSRGVQFYIWLLFFMASMIGLAMAQDLLLLFMFWELTTIASYFLIGFDSHRKEARRAALLALLVTGITSLFFLIGALLLFNEYQSFAIRDLIAAARPNGRLTAAVGLIALGALAKSAQIPFHFWLPRAMAAPTPVSAYLHSAAMVAAGVFLLSRIYPLLHASAILLDLLIAVGLLSMVVGSLFALQEDAIKRVLAYSTIAQYGYIVFLLGLGGSTAVAAASFYTLTHALIKSALFMTAGAIIQATGREKLSSLGGLARSVPWLAGASAIAAAGLAGLPLTGGFFKDELLFRAALERGAWLAVAAALNAALTLAYTWRLWSGIFLGRKQVSVSHVPWTLTAPVVILGGLVALGGIWWAPFERLASAAASSAWGQPVSIELAYHLDARAENILALAVYGLGSMLIFLRAPLQPLLAFFSQIGERIGPERVSSLVSRVLERGSGFLYNFELHDLANRIATILIPTAGLVLLGLWVTPSSGGYRVSGFSLEDAPLALALMLTALSAVVVAIPRNHLTQILLLSSVNFALAGVFAFFGAPNLALVGVLVGVVSTLMFVAFLTIFPQRVLRQGETASVSSGENRRHVITGLLAGGGAFLVAWRILSYPASRESVAETYMELAPSVHAKDVVTAILSDWRGLDTLGEVTVLAVILVGVGSFWQLRSRQ